MRFALMVPYLFVAVEAATIPAIDSARGQKVFESEGCYGCHGVGGVIGKSAPDISVSVNRNLTPDQLAATMWNHAPVMWSAMRKSGTPIPQLSEQDAGDLFAFFYASRYFDRRGDAARGKRIFAARYCATCHQLSLRGPGGTVPVSEWRSLGNSLDLAEAMWNHAGQMKQEFARRNLPWQALAPQELADILVYIRSLSGKRHEKMSFELGSGERGAEIFAEKGCAVCHTGRLSLESRLRDKTVADIAVAMWNHVPQMSPSTPQRFAPGEMGQLLNYLWAGPYLAGAGDANRGRRIFAGKGCGSCHGDHASGAPDLSKMKRSFSSISMVSALWSHGPTMLDRMRQKNITWPRFEGHDMGDLIAFLNR